MAFLGVVATGSSASSGLGTRGVEVAGSPAPGVAVDFELGLSWNTEGRRSTSMYTPGGTGS